MTMVKSVLTQLGINDTLWIQLGVFTFLYLFLRFVYFGPFLRLIELRAKESTGVETEASALTERVESLEKDWFSRIQEARKVARERKEQAVKVALSESSQQLAKVRTEAKVKIEGAREELAKSAVGARTEATGQVDTISKLFVDKLMHAKVEL